MHFFKRITYEMKLGLTFLKREIPVAESRKCIHTIYSRIELSVKEKSW